MYLTISLVYIPKKTEWGFSNRQDSEMGGEKSTPSSMIEDKRKIELFENLSLPLAEIERKGANEDLLTSVRINKNEWGMGSGFQISGAGFFRWSG